MLAAVLVAGLIQIPPPPQPQPQPPSPDGQPAPAGAGIIRGRVVTADTGAPVRDCSVMLQAPNSPPVPTRTDDQGKFEFSRLAAGAYRLFANGQFPPGRYLSLSYGARAPGERGQTIDLGASQVVEGLVIRLPRSGVLAGRVVDEFGEPVSHIGVNAIRRSENGEPQSVGGYMMHGTDDLGRFRLFGLVPGDYFVVAEAQHFGGPDDGNPIRHLPTYLPSTLSLAEAAVVRLRAGQEVGELEIRLVRGRTYKVTGTILSSQGKPFSSWSGHVMFVESKLGGVSTSQGVSLGGDGTFRVSNVKPGSYTLEVAPMRRRPDDEPSANAEFAYVPVTVTDSDIEGLVVTTQPGATVAGELVFDDSQGNIGHSLEVSATTAIQRTFGGSFSRAKVNDDGTFVLQGLFQPRLIRVAPPRGYHLASVTFDGQDITNTPTDFKTGTTAKLVVTLTRRASELSGQVADNSGRPVSEGFIVLAFSDDRVLWLPFATTTKYGPVDEKGAYRIMGLPPGRYLVVSVKARPPLWESSPDVWEALARDATVVTVGDNERKVLDLRVRPVLQR